MCVCRSGMFVMSRTIIFTLVLAFNAGSIWAQDFQKGFAAAQSGDYVTALQGWRPLAEQGDVDAQYNLGVMYDNGWGVLQDYAEAMKWYRLAADQGNETAQYNIGVSYHKGDAVLHKYSCL